MRWLTGRVRRRDLVHLAMDLGGGARHHLALLSGRPHLIAGARARAVEGGDARDGEGGGRREVGGDDRAREDAGVLGSVSYTHLTLPTILRV